MDESCARELVDLAQAGMPNEICGFIVKPWTPLPCKNTSRTPHRAFNMEDDVLLDLLLYRSDNVIGIYHSHPSLRHMPSPDDENLLTLYPAIRHWIVTTMNVYEWRMTDDGARPVRRDGSIGTTGMAYPLLTFTETL